MSEGAEEFVGGDDGKVVPLHQTPLIDSSCEGDAQGILRCGDLPLAVPPLDDDERLIGHPLLQLLLRGEEE